MTSAQVDAKAFIQGMWAGVAEAWGIHADELEQRSSAITEAMLAGAQLSRGDRVLELACGPGGAGLAAAKRAASGEVVVSDVVPAMVDIALRRAQAGGLGNVRGEVLDLEAIGQPDGSFDVVLCREGLMFAFDPARAVAEMHRVLRSGGRVAVASWAAQEDNPWLGVLLDAIHDATGMVVPPPGMPGPFALGDRDLLRRLFGDAGFSEILIDAVAAPLRSASFDAWWARNLAVAGPVVAVLRGLDDDGRQRVRNAAQVAVSPYVQDGALVLPGVALVLTGRRP
jgi:ubiquinone/menaquinone biosynthesis C-methylase UbiE